jgi:hypothetical protein
VIFGTPGYYENPAGPVNGRNESKKAAMSGFFAKLGWNRDAIAPIGWWRFLLAVSFQLSADS